MTDEKEREMPSIIIIEECKSRSPLKICNDEKKSASTTCSKVTDTFVIKSRKNHKNWKSLPEELRLCCLEYWFDIALPVLYEIIISKNQDSATIFSNFTKDLGKTQTSRTSDRKRNKDTIENIIQNFYLKCDEGIVKITRPPNACESTDSKTSEKYNSTSSIANVEQITSYQTPNNTFSISHSSGVLSQISNHFFQSRSSVTVPTETAFKSSYLSLQNYQNQSIFLPSGTAAEAQNNPVPSALCDMRYLNATNLTNLPEYQYANIAVNSSSTGNIEGTIIQLQTQHTYPMMPNYELTDDSLTGHIECTLIPPQTQHTYVIIANHDLLLKQINEHEILNCYLCHDQIKGEYVQCFVANHHFCLPCVKNYVQLSLENTMIFCPSQKFCVIQTDIGVLPWIFNRSDLHRILSS